MFPKNTTRYEPVPTGEGASSQSPPAKRRGGIIGCIKDSYLRSPALYCAIISIVMIAAFLLGIYVGVNHPGDTTCVKKLSMYSPLNDVVEYEEYNFDNMFSHKTAFRGPPTPELEQLWADAWQMGEIRVPEDKLPTLNKDRPPRNWKKIPEEHGGGYAAGIMMFHQLHCLNYIRQYTWGDYYERHNLTVPLRSTAVGQRLHVDHCIEELRKTIMCYGDTTPMLVEVTPKSPIGEKSDFDARHKCRNFDKLHKYMEENVISWW